jgi:hypothetical protein
MLPRLKMGAGTSRSTIIIEECSEPIRKRKRSDWKANRVPKKCVLVYSRTINPEIPHNFIYFLAVFAPYW